MINISSIKSGVQNLKKLEIKEKSYYSCNIHRDYEVSQLVESY